MSNNHLVRLPQAMLSSDDYRALNADQRNSLSVRIEHCMEIAEAAENAALKSGTELFSTIDDIELDALSIMSAFSDVTATVSPYRVHSSWLFDCDKQAMSRYVDRAAAQFLASASFPFEAAPTELKTWLQRWAATIRATQDRLRNSASFTEAVVQLVVIDALLAAILVFTAASRLNTQVNQ
jgi:hypothetical protein